ncbi:hypothetical protein LMK08_12490 [Metapseudomonas furukawaii]|uniref:hypothetical protein n=1 Tax=Metapseudomonas furukawaii TaxID=1149133 RepID=UPI00227B71FE|nr:hypothetical protein [Pseudomonas furukawaii]WAG81435.1 hypothetical protein LMK08_12490 [Pseudomonas furukawaii]
MSTSSTMALPTFPLHSVVQEGPEAVVAVVDAEVEAVVVAAVVGVVVAAETI